MNISYHINITLFVIIIILQSRRYLFLICLKKKINSMFIFIVFKCFRLYCDKKQEV